MKSHQAETHPYIGCPWQALLLSAGMALLAQTARSQPKVITEHFTYLPGEPITVYFEGGPGNAKDWIGIYPDGVEPGSVGSTIWSYSDGAGGATGLSQGSVTFDEGLVLTGDWVAFLLENDAYDVLASNHFRVIDHGMPLVRVDKPIYTPGRQ
jgi:hypothetical protein